MLTILIYGDAKVGKSWLAASAPKPLLVLDVEGRGHYLPNEKKITWDVNEPPPAAGDWEVCVAPIFDFKGLVKAYAWLQRGEHCFVSVDIDSLTEAQKRFLDERVGLNVPETQDWGAVLRHLEKLVRDYRDLVRSPSNTVECVVFVAGEEPDDSGKKRPLLQGALRKHLAYLVDVCGYMYVTHDQQGTMSRNLLIQPTATIVAGDGTGKLTGPVISEPDLTRLYEELI
jgi:hypothetical protein